MTLLEIKNKNISLEAAAKDATEAYEQAARNFDELKEFCIAELGLLNTGEFIHGMAHEFPKLFDKIGDILRMRRLRQHYGATAEFNAPTEDLEDVFSHMSEALFEIDKKLGLFILRCKETNADALGLLAEELLVKNGEMTGRVLDVWAMYQNAKSAVSFDNWVGRYLNSPKGEE